MSILENIRNRAGLLVAIIGGALLIFILQAALESGKWFANDRSVGEVAGKTIEHDEFDFKVKQVIDNYKRQTQQTTIDPATEDMAVQQTWNGMVNEIIMGKEIAKLGIAVSEDELYDMMLVHPAPMVVQQFTDRETGRIAKDFVDPMTGKLDIKKLNALVQQMNPEQEAAWAEVEKAVKAARISQKYAMLIKKGFYTTSVEAKQVFAARNKQFSIHFAVKKFNAIADSTVKVEEKDLNAYYNEHQNYYKQEEEARKIDYVSFDVVPTAEDIDGIKNDLVKVLKEFGNKGTKEDSALVIAEADSRFFDLNLHKKGTLSPIIDTIFFKAEEEGFLYGPYRENNFFKVSKIEKVKTLYDSVKVNHALFAYKGAERAAQSVNKNKEQAKHYADSLMKLINEKKLKFEDVNKLSDDLVSKTKGGEIGWLNAGSGFAPPFKYGSLAHKKGEIVLVESSFGFHIIQVVDNSKNSAKYLQVATIDKKIEPSTKTIQSYYSKALAFAGKHNSGPLFDKGADEDHLNKRVADNVKNGDKNIPGFESPRELVRWMYDDKRKKDDVSEPFDIGGRFIVARLAEIRPKGILPLDIVRDMVEVKAKEAKKAAQLVEAFSKQLVGVNTIEAFGQKANLPVETVENMGFSAYSLKGIGREDAVVGTAACLKQGTVSKPIIGRAGVFVISIDGLTEKPAPTSVTMLQGELNGNLQTRAEYELNEALKDASHVVDRKAKFY